MLVKANTGSDYLLNPLNGELELFNALFSGLVMACPTGWTFKGYDSVPGVLVKDEEFIGKIPAKTRSFDTKTEALHSLKLGLEITSGKIMDVATGLYMPRRHIYVSRSGVTADHIPQVYGRYPTGQHPGRVCVAVSGDYDMSARLFYGIADFADVGELWSA